MSQARETNRIVVEELPELDTEVAVSSSTKQQEVGGGLCVGIAVGIAIVMSV